jgi:hypothetical protein
MSLPQFPDVCDDLTLDCSVSQILVSIAMEELALSHIINAEGEKIQYVLGTLPGASQQAEPPTIDELIKINESVKDMLAAISMSQMYLFGKMSTALFSYQKNKPDIPAQNER